MKVIALGLDCDSPPDYAEVAARGYRWVGRYLPPHDNPLTRAEMQEAALHDIGILALCEHSTNDVNGGAAQGRVLAEQWVKSAQGLSIALGAALILACDEDPSSVPRDVAAAFYSASTSYCRGARYLGGAYGGHDLMVLLSGHVDVLMQSYAWSGGVQAPGIDVFQGVSQTTIGGVTFDEDQAFAVHFGAFNADGLWPHVAPDPPKPTPPKPAPKPVPRPVRSPEEDPVFIASYKGGDALFDPMTLTCRGIPSPAVLAFYRALGIKVVAPPPGEVDRYTQVG